MATAGVTHSDRGRPHGVSIVLLLLCAACAVSAMLSEVASSGVSHRVRSGGQRGEEVRGDMEFDVALCETQLTQRSLQLYHLLPPGFIPVSWCSDHVPRGPVATADPLTRPLSSAWHPVEG